MQFSGKNSTWGKTGLLIALIISFLVLISEGKPSGPDNTPESKHQSEFNSGSINSVVNSGIDLYTFQRLSNVQRVCYARIYHNLNPVLENKIAENKIRLSFLPGIDRLNCSFLIHHYHLFGPDNDDVPPLA